MGETLDFDVLVIGGGGAGLTAALGLAETVGSIAVLAKRPLEESSTYQAQGGIAAVLDETDSIDSHVQDTLTAGAGLCHEDAVRFIAERGPAAIEKLSALGVEFTREDGESGDGVKDRGLGYHLTREGGHSARRVVHSFDATGAAVAGTLAAQVRARNSIHCFDRHLAVDLIVREGRCIGAYVLDVDAGRVRTFRAKAVVLATGGASKVYLYTSNPDGSTGDGVAMAWRAGCRVANMEFCQFHPTCLYHPQAKGLLITEAVRGEGGRLLLPDGARFMDEFDPRGELAPRDIVARAIDHVMKRDGLDCVYLDISHKPASFVTSHFPNVHRRCLEFGFDMTREPLPVVPAAHYTCGGVVTDLAGRTDIVGLYAVGEAACTGLHGANRMASNSLLECLVIGTAAAEAVAEELPRVPPPGSVAEWDESWVIDSDEEVVVAHNWEELRRFMWDYVGIVRTTKRLERAKHRVDLLAGEIEEYYGNFRVTPDLLELRNLTQVADLIIRSALSRRESRGLHYTLDHPGPDRWAADTVLSPDPKRRRQTAEA